MSIFVVLLWALCGVCWWGLRDTDEINFSIALRSAGERVFCGYMKSAVLSQQCAVTAFGEWFYFIVLHGGQSVTVSLISHLTQ